MSAPTAHRSRVSPGKPKLHCKPIPWRRSPIAVTLTVRRLSRAHHCDLAEADDVGCQVRGPLRQARLRLLADDDVYRCPAGERLKYYYTNVENGLTLRRYWTNACRTCALKSRCTTGVQRRITRWEHEHMLEAVQQRLDQDPQAMRRRRETVEHPFGTIKARMGGTHFLMKTLPRVAAEMALHVLAYNLTRVLIGPGRLIAAMRA